MTAPTYDQLVAAIDRVVAAHYAEADDDQGVTAVLREIEASIEDAAELVDRASRQEQAQRTARRLSEPTGQPVEPDPDSRPPAHAGSPNRTPSTLTPLA